MPLRGEDHGKSQSKDRLRSNRILARYADLDEVQIRKSLFDNSYWHVEREFRLVPGLVVITPKESQPAVKALAAGASDATDGLFQRIAELEATGLFAYVEPDYELRAFVEPAESRFADGTLWALRNTGQSGGRAGADLDVISAWDLTTGSTNVIVAVIDTGIRHTHVDLASQMWRNPNEIPGNGIDDDRDGYVDNIFGINAITGSGNPIDDNDHGTHVAGTIGAAANNGHPHVGVAWNVRLMGCKFLDANGGGSTIDAIECIDFAVANGARILNNSWGGVDFSQGLLDAISRARDRGVLFVAAAGNEGSDNDRLPTYPATHQLDNVLSVAAVDRADNLASFSNFGLDTVQLGAPGVAIFSTSSGSDTEYKTFSGTSMAAPHVSGVAALVIARFPDISLTELRQRILLGTSPIESLKGGSSTGGRLNARRALEIVPDNVLEISISTPAGSRLTAGAAVPVFVTVTDLLPVTNAIVTGHVPGRPEIVFSNTGVTPDSSANDATYTALLDVPISATSLSLTVNVTANGKNPGSKSIMFHVELPPANDSFANRIVINPAAPTVAGTNRKATREAGEPFHARVGGVRSVWWSWTAPATGIATFSTAGSSFDTVIAVYVGNSVSALSLRGSNDDVQFGVPTSEVIRNVTAGATYQIAVDGFRGASGDIILTVAVIPPVSNNSFGQRAPLSGINFSIAGSNFGATREAGEPNHAGELGGRSVWWSWTAPRTERVIISTAGSTFDTLLGVYRGTTVSGLSLVADSDDVVDSIVTTSQAAFNAQANQTYQIAVDGFDGDVGNITLSIVSLPPNNQFADSLPLTGVFTETSGHNLGASKEPTEPNHAGDRGNQSVWWSWTAPVDGNATITTLGSNFDTVLAVYIGATVFNLTSISSNDDIERGIVRQSQVTFAARAGVNYRIAVDGFNIESVSDSGLIALTIVLNTASKFGRVTRLIDGSVRLPLFGEPNRSYVFQASTDLRQWLPISTNTLIGKSFVFFDPATNLTQRFYRAQPASLIEVER